MHRVLPITDLYAREILDSRGNPTIEVEVLAGEDAWGRAAVPSGASTGTFEAVEVRDGGARYRGLGTEKAVDTVNTVIAPELLGRNVFDQREIDRQLLRMDGTKEKARLGANAILGVSMAAARAAADALGLPLYRYFGGMCGGKMPVPMMNIVNGGKHADNTLDFQEFMIVPAGACCFREALRMGAETYHALKEVLKEKGLHTGVGDEGGFAPDLPDAKAALEVITEAIRKAGYTPGKEISIALDAAASELYDEKTKQYQFAGEHVSRSAVDMIEYYRELSDAFPVVSIEDPLDEEDWEGWKQMTECLGDRIRLVGDDLFVTSRERLAMGIAKKAANAILIKVNQIGTLTEAFETLRLAKEAGYQTILSHRSGETQDTIISDIAVAFGADRIKAGAPCRSERVEKYNQLLRIEEQL